MLVVVKLVNNEFCWYKPISNIIFYFLIFAFYYSIELEYWFWSDCEVAVELKSFFERTNKKI